VLQALITFILHTINKQSIQKRRLGFGGRVRADALPAGIVFWQRRGRQPCLHQGGMCSFFTLQWGRPPVLSKAWCVSLWPCDGGVNPAINMVKCASFWHCNGDAPLCSAKRGAFLSDLVMGASILPSIGWSALLFDIAMGTPTCASKAWCVSLWPCDGDVNPAFNKIKLRFFFTLQWGRPPVPAKRGAFLSDLVMGTSILPSIR